MRTPVYRRRTLVGGSPEGLPTVASSGATYETDYTSFGIFMEEAKVDPVPALPNPLLIQSFS